MKQTYRVLAGLIALGVLVQAAAVAFGWFQVISDVETGQVFDENSEFNLGHVVHLVGGMYVIPLLALVLLIVSFFAAKTVPHARKWAGIVFGLVVLQVALAIFAFMLAPAIGALHGVNALLLLGSAIRAQTLTTSGAVTRRRDESAVTIPAQSTGSSAPESSRSV